MNAIKLSMNSLQTLPLFLPSVMQQLNVPDKGVIHCNNMCDLENISSACFPWLIFFMNMFVVLEGTDCSKIKLSCMSAYILHV